MIRPNELPKYKQESALNERSRAIWGWLARAIIAVAITMAVFMALAGCGTSAKSLVRQLAKEGEFETVQVLTRRGDQIKVKYREPATDGWMD